MTWKDVALKLVDELGGGICLGEIFEEMSYLFGDEVKCCDCKECLVRHIEKEEE